MIMKKKIAFICFVVILTVVTYTVIMFNNNRMNRKTEYGYTKEIELIPQDQVDSYQIEKYTQKASKAQAPDGILVWNDQILICDEAQHCILIYDLDMNYMGKFGKLGNGDGEFSEPRGIAAYQNEIYVLDSGNSRIQFFNSQFQYQREIALDLLPDYQAGSRYTDIVAGTDGTLYLSTDSMIEEANKIYIVSGEKIEKTKQTIVGPLLNYDGKIYAADTYEYHSYGEQIEMASGYNNLYQIKDGNAILVKQLPNKLTPVSGMQYGNKICLLSASQGIGVEISLEDEENRALFQVDTIKLGMRMAVVNEKDFLITDRENNIIYYYRREK